MPVGQEPVLARREVQRAARFIQDDEIVSGSLHLGEADSHGRDYPRTAPLATAFPERLPIMREWCELPNFFTRCANL